jgi:hypothetical protein
MIVPAIARYAGRVFKAFGDVFPGRVRAGAAQDAAPRFQSKGLGPIITSSKVANETGAGS